LNTTSPNERTANLAASPIFVVPTVGPHRRIEKYTPLFKRYAEKSRLYRVYCHPDRFEEAKALVSATVVPRSPR
jgi:hypothetical protein